MDVNIRKMTTDELTRAGDNGDATLAEIEAEFWRRQRRRESIATLVLHVLAAAATVACAVHHHGFQRAAFAFMVAVWAYLVFCEARRLRKVW